MSEDDTGDSESRRSLLRRRRANTPGGRRDRIVVKVTADEEQLLRARADLAGVSVQRLMVTRALSPERAARPGHDARVAAWQQACDLRNLIAALGNNMNQIARQANSEEMIPADFAPALAAVTQAHRRVVEAFTEVYGVGDR